MDTTSRSAELSFRHTSHDDLISGRSPWGRQALRPHRRPLTENVRTDVAVIGGGITGALLAEHLTATGHQVMVIDREELGLGSTRASTALLQWEIDTPLAGLTELYGFETAAHIYRRSRAAVAGLAETISTNRIACRFEPRPTLYLAAGETGARDLYDELALRQRAGLPGELLDHRRLQGEFGFDREAAILSPGSAEADPLALCWGLLQIAADRGAALINADAVNFHEEGVRVMVETAGGHVVDARHVVLATGYVMPHFVMPERHRTASTFALATVPQKPDVAWRGRALVWEASDPYLYMRMTSDSRIIVGGEDEDIADPDQRDAMIATKIGLLQDKLSRLWPKADIRLSEAWAGAFGQTSDGLPLIGPVSGTQAVYAAYGYGGNGITFSYLASRMIAAMISGRHEAWFDDFALDRDPR
ncbi:NAD(P)/FAD-dependent oxidoreductase [Neorhizobium alkalisoli]|uniref:Glycine/D-amino acid oxidase-like deaminating enzyme n=1 Tax=Neorhizobium alkalisoli TaxID=528178 RepID=A0A561QWK5_9HYPH|nr:FAD-dependent oxidoreductase [Neorhizobium alkalisoli]TWF54755.1 glycine/D-amino acid oxidase-like deaminating enzyme [Neorhizobium alkalisoli]